MLFLFEFLVITMKLKTGNKILEKNKQNYQHHRLCFFICLVNTT